MNAKASASAVKSARSAQHASFVIERVFEASPAQVFAAWATAEGKARWFGGSAGKWRELERAFDFRVGGRERLKGAWDNGTVSDFEAHYRDIVPERRIVYTYDMHLDDKRISVSLSTVELAPADKGTKLIYTEQAVFLDGYDDAGSRERGTRELLNKLEAVLRQTTMPLVVERRFAAPADRVWKAITDNEDMRRWYFDIAEFRPEVGFEFQFEAQDNEGRRWIHRCRVAEVIRGQKLAYSWRYEGSTGNSLVTFELFPEGNHTRLRLTHTGLESFPPVPAFARKNFEAGWTALIGKNLKDFLEAA